MAATITPTQTRINDPYQQQLFDYNTVDSKIYLSRETNKLLTAIGTDIVLRGFDCSDVTIDHPTTLYITMDSGIAIHDSTLIEITEEATVDLDCSGLTDTVTGGAHLGVFLKYQYIQSIEYNRASIEVFHIASDGTVTDTLSRFSSSTCRILLTIIDFTKPSTSITSAAVSSLTQLLVNGVLMTKKGWVADHFNLPEINSLLDSDEYEYLLKRDFLLMA
jgi:hypothetical protein